MVELADTLPCLGSDYFGRDNRVGSSPTLTAWELCEHGDGVFRDDGIRVCNNCNEKHPIPMKGNNVQRDRKTSKWRQ